MSATTTTNITMSVVEEPLIYETGSKFFKTNFKAAEKMRMGYEKRNSELVESSKQN